MCWCTTHVKEEKYKISLDLHNHFCKLNQNQKKLAFNLSSSPSGSPHASENNRTTFGPSQPPCNLKTKTKVCHDTQKKEEGNNLGPK